MNFDQAFERLIGHEGGYLSAAEALRQGDPGGETKFGISKAAYPSENIAAMTLERAKAIYLRDYWRPAGCEVVGDGVKYSLFDMAVNSGVKQAVKSLQRAVGVAEDGSIGPKTLDAISKMGEDKTRLRFSAARRLLMTGLKSWGVHGRGWMIRVAENDLL